MSGMPAMVLAGGIILIGLWLMVLAAYTPHDWLAGIGVLIALFGTVGLAVEIERRDK